MATIASDSPLPRREVRRTRGTPWVASLAAVALLTLLVISVGLSLYILLRPPTPDPAAQSELATVRQSLVSLSEQVGKQSDALLGYAQDVEELRRRLDALPGTAAPASSASATAPASASVESTAQDSSLTTTETGL